MVKQKAGKPHKANGREARISRQKSAIARFQEDITKAKKFVKHPDPNQAKAAQRTVELCERFIRETEENIKRGI